MLTDHKITAEAVAEKGIVAAPDKLSGTAAENKALFDRLVREVVAGKINDLIDEIVTELAGKMPAPTAEGVAGQYLRIGEEGMEWGVPGGSGDMIAAIYDPDGDGSVVRADIAGATEGNAATATALQTARSLTVTDADGSNEGMAVSFDGGADVVLKLPGKIRADIVGSLTGSVTGNVTGSSGSCTGAAASAAKLQTARKIGEASFDGGADISLAAMGATKAANINVASSTLNAFTARRIYISNAVPSASSGAVGDLWLKY